MSALPKKTGLSLYADLLDPGQRKTDQGATISGAPVKYDIKKRERDEGEAQKKKDASLKFQPIRRPQVQQKNKPKQSSSSVHKFSSSTVTAASAMASSPDKQLPASTPSHQPSLQRSNFEDWVGDDDDDAYYYENKRKQERGGRKKKRKDKQQETRVWDWDDIYDPTLPNSYAEYKGSEEQYREIRDWKARLYYYQLKEARKQSKSGAAHSDGENDGKPLNAMFAPPANLNFAPPSLNDDTLRQSGPPDDDDDDDYYPRAGASDRLDDDDAYKRAPSFAPASVPNDATGEDAYTRRMQMGNMQPPQRPIIPPPSQVPISPLPTAPVGKPTVDIEAKKAEAAAKIAAFKAKVEADRAKKANQSTSSPTPPVQSQTPSAPAPPLPAQRPIYDEHHAPPPPPPPPPPPEEDSGVSISRAPIRYQLAQTPVDSAATDDVDVTMVDDALAAPSDSDQPRSSRPGQKGFAERLLKKYGWEKGKGLGTQGDGITTAIYAKPEKRKKLSDAEGGGWAKPANMGKIVGGKKRKVGDGDVEEDDNQLGEWSEVVKLEGMLNNLDVDYEIQEKSLYDEIGKEMEDCGKVERVFVWRKELGGNDDVFVKFTSKLSGLRAVKGWDGMTFAGNVMSAGFFDAEKFERGEYA